MKSFFYGIVAFTALVAAKPVVIPSAADGLDLSVEIKPSKIDKPVIVEDGSHYKMPPTPAVPMHSDDEILFNMTI
eukprot:Awhi_evm1s12728